MGTLHLEITEAMPGSCSLGKKTRRLGKGLVLEPVWVRMPFWAGRVQLSTQQVDQQCSQHLPTSLF